MDSTSPIQHPQTSEATRSDIRFRSSPRAKSIDLPPSPSTISLNGPKRCDPSLLAPRALINVVFSPFTRPESGNNETVGSLLTISRSPSILEASKPLSLFSVVSPKSVALLLLHLLHLHLHLLQQPANRPFLSPIPPRFC